MLMLVPRTAKFRLSGMWEQRKREREKKKDGGRVGGGGGGERD
jgi:hypothetical protein